ncbi:MAG TPA: hypothetical protein V6C52_01870 [Coleofasciculaceae cyanobacterium]|jgi:hypothetical protein
MQGPTLQFCQKNWPVHKPGYPVHGPGAITKDHPGSTETIINKDSVHFGKAPGTNPPPMPFFGKKGPVILGGWDAQVKFGKSSYPGTIGPIPLIKRDEAPKFGKRNGPGPAPWHQGEGDQDLWTKKDPYSV